jgi:uncharacterized protein (TIGR03435 family)
MKALALLLSAAAAICAQPAAFDVAVIKPADLTNPQRGIGIEPGHRMLTVSGLTVSELIQRTYSIQESQVSGAQLSGVQSWMNADRFDITAKVERATAPSTDELWSMLEQLLADRFALKFHRETEQRQGYALTTVKTGAKLSSSSDGTPNLSVSRGQLHASRATLPMFINAMSRYLGRPIADETGLTGAYDFKMMWTPGETEQALPSDDHAPAADPFGPTIFTAMQDQLGLRLESKKVPITIFVIDQVARPSDN